MSKFKKGDKVRFIKLTGDWGKWNGKSGKIVRNSDHGYSLLLDKSCRYLLPDRIRSDSDTIFCDGKFLELLTKEPVKLKDMM